MNLARLLNKMSREQKLAATETIWADLARDEADFTSPNWHSAELKKVETLVLSGKATFSDWEIAKQRILRKTIRSMQTI